MLRTFPELAAYFENDNGRFSFSDTDAVIETYANRVSQTQDILNTSKMAESLAANKNLRTNALRSENAADTYGAGAFSQDAAKGFAATVIAAMAAGAAGGIKAGATAGAVASPLTGGLSVPLIAAIGALTGAVTGLGLATVKNVLATKESEEALNKLQEAYDSTGGLVFSSYDEFAKALDGISEKTIKALWDNRESLEKLAKETNLNTQ